MWLSHSPFQTQQNFRTRSEWQILPMVTLLTISNHCHRHTDKLQENHSSMLLDPLLTAPFLASSHLARDALGTIRRPRLTGCSSVLLSDPPSLRTAMRSSAESSCAIAGPSVGPASPSLWLPCPAQASRGHCHYLHFIFKPTVWGIPQYNLQILFLPAWRPQLVCEFVIFRVWHGVDLLSKPWPS